MEQRQWHSAYGTVFMKKCKWHGVYGTMFMEDCLWHSVYGAVSMAQCLWHSVYGTVFMAQCPWHSVHGTVFIQIPYKYLGLPILFIREWLRSCIHQTSQNLLVVLLVSCEPKLLASSNRTIFLALKIL
jgi:hypothetical protein